MGVGLPRRYLYSWVRVSVRFTHEHIDLWLAESTIALVRLSKPHIKFTPNLIYMTTAKSMFMVVFELVNDQIWACQKGVQSPWTRGINTGI